MHNNRLALSIDIKNIAKLLPKYRLAKSFPKYSELNEEGKIATVEVATVLAIMHELRHVLQFMNEPEKIDEHLKRGVSMQRAMVSAIGVPVLTTPLALSSQMGMLSAIGINIAAMSPLLIKEIQYTRNLSSLEKDAYHATESPNLAELTHKPFNFEVETDAQPSIS